MNQKLEIEFSKADIFKEVDALKKQIDDMRPLPADVEGRVMQKLRLDWNYNSNAIEGNKLSYGETTALLMHGITAKGKPLKDHLDIQGHNEAIDLLLRMVQDERPLTETDIRGLHEVILGKPHNAPAQTADGTPTTKLITVGEYKTMPNHVQTVTGAIHYYASPEETPAKMQELMDWYNEASNNSDIHPIVIAALFHHRFVAIHPFDDGNGRMARILMNLVLMRNGFPVIVIKANNKDEYYSLLSQADVGDLMPFIEYINDKVERSVTLYLKAVDGGDINDDDDIDKELALFKLELKGYTTITEKKSDDGIKRVLKEDLLPLINKVFKKASIFDEFFFNNIKLLKIFKSQTDNDYDSFSFPFNNEIVNNVKFKIFKVEFVYLSQDFKNDLNHFQVYNSYHIIFDDFNYRVFISNHELLKGFYDSPIGSDKQQQFVKSIIDQIKNQIQKSIKKA